MKSLQKAAVIVAIMAAMVGAMGAYSGNAGVARAQTAGASAPLYAANGTPVGNVAVVSTGAGGTQLSVTLQGPANATYAVCASSPVPNQAAPCLPPSTPFGSIGASCLPTTLSFSVGCISSFGSFGFPFGNVGATCIPVGTFFAQGCIFATGSPVVGSLTTNGSGSGTTSIGVSCALPVVIVSVSNTANPNDSSQATLNISAAGGSLCIPSFGL